MQSFKKFKFLVIFKLSQIFRVLHAASGQATWRLCLQAPGLPTFARTSDFWNSWEASEVPTIKVIEN